MSVHNPRGIKCNVCGSPFSPMQVERIIRGETVICETCGSEYKANMQDIEDISPNRGMEPKNLFRPDDLGLGHQRPKPFSPRPGQNPPFKRFGPGNQRRPIIHVDDNHPKINEKNIIRGLSFEWKSLRELSNAIGVSNRKEFYILRMKINEMRRNGLIEVDYQVDRVMLRRSR